MDTLKKFFGIAGNNSQRTALVIAAADDLVRESRELNRRMARYAAQPDPFMALVSDMINRRALRGEQRKP